MFSDAVGKEKRSAVQDNPSFTFHSGSQLLGMKTLMEKYKDM